MKSRIVKIIGSSLALVLMGQSGAIAAEPGYYPTGPQTDVSVTQISTNGWTKCYEANYGTTILTLANLKAQCSGDFVLYAGGETADPNHYLLLAAGLRSVVWAGTNVTANTVTTLGANQFSNGSYWYAQDALSLGFTPDPVVRLFQADLCAAIVCAGEKDDGSLRLSWHGNGLGVGGWNIGNDITFQNNGVTDYVKAIWVSNGSPTKPPLIQTTALTATLDKNILTCTTGKYKASESEVAISSVKYQLFVNGQLMSSVAIDKGLNIPDSAKSAPMNKVPALVSAKEALFDLTGISSYSAYCTVEAYGYGSSTTSASNVVKDSVLLAAIAATEKAWDLERAAAVAANFSKEAREKRKRLAALANR